ncbi:acetolactate synthase large subunit IlvB [Gottschalkia acidurici 9a]|uniref:Acetolactate synthase n=1 Tax=Gottschalkia acidurici (strain ATCC 7906 / DSM 604 / BCRC 14475 / CIP 104303 / KCTC 5404 / NCIMB 10678 / 9a) TaxID=1128398 RepID=K0AZL8_GOTA9|nr:biosynthetic-type acetolactate synthase large subunit [Gottschalkia acidurici]AFS78227.1 acetolactate synthase large subunit IlvB [Gottschalkia acidurici 9a]
MIASDAIIKCLEEENVEIIFGYPGGALLPIYESMRKSNIKHILVRQEQSAAHNASGYARASGKVGVCMATSGPGATNLITGIATAYMDSVPMVIITGQVDSSLIGKDIFQEADIVGSTLPFTKYNCLVKNAEDIPRILKEAFYIAKTGRPGPVLIDIPSDIQQKNINFEYPSEVDIRGYKPISEGHIGQIKRAIRKIKNSKRPIICAGGGVSSANANRELRIFAEKVGIPVVYTLMGIGAIDSDSKFNFGMVGSHGHSYANKLVNKSDLIIVIGARIANRSAITQSAKETDIIHIDIDTAEIGKNLSADIPVVGDAKNILSDLIDRLDNIGLEDWINEAEEIKGSYQKKEEITENINPRKAIKFISDTVDDDTILTGDVGQNQMWCARNFEVKGNRRFITSGGLGTMGYSLPASIGAKFGAEDRTVIGVMGDGSIQMLLSELGVIREYDLDIKIIVFNNSRLGMVRELQDNTYGKGNNNAVVFKHSPDFVKIADGFGIKGIKVNSNEDFEKAFKECLDLKEPFLIECIVDSDFSTI